MPRTSLPLVLILALSATALTPAYAHNGDVLEGAWAGTAPAVDGTVSEGEWAGEGATLATKTYVQRLDASITVNAGNDDRRLYLLLHVNPPEDVTVNSSGYRLLGIYLDVNHDGVFNEGEDLIITQLSDNTGRSVFHVRVHQGSHGQYADASVGWTGRGWIYETSIPFIFSDGYKWGEPGAQLGLAVDWITYEKKNTITDIAGRQFGDRFWGVEEIIVPPDAVYHYTGSQVDNPGIKTTVPYRFMDIVLADSGSEEQSTLTPQEAPAEVETVAETDAPPDGSEGNGGEAPDTDMGIYVAVGIAAAGGAIAGAIALTRRKGSGSRTA